MSDTENVRCRERTAQLCLPCSTRTNERLCQGSIIYSQSPLREQRSKEIPNHFKQASKQAKRERKYKERISITILSPKRDSGVYAHAGIFSKPNQIRIDFGDLYQTNAVFISATTHNLCTKCKERPPIQPSKRSRMKDLPLNDVQCETLKRYRYPER